jgi:hypothetical protein
MTEVSVSREMDLFERVWEESEKAHAECRRLRITVLLHFEAHDGTAHVSNAPA